MPPLTNYRAVPSGMSFDLDTGSVKTAYLLSTPGNAAVVALTGSGLWSIEVLASIDGVDYTLLATITSPGQRRYDTKGKAAIAVRVKTYTPGSGIISGQLTHGALLPSTNVSPLFGSFLTFSYNNTPSEPPTGNQIRFDSANFPAVTKCWIANSSVDGVDQYHALRHVPYGGTLLLQNKTDHLGAVLFGILAPPIDKGAYIEVPIAFQQGITALNSQQVILAVFVPGASLSLSATVLRDAYLSSEVLAIPPRARSHASVEDVDA